MLCLILFKKWVIFQKVPLLRNIILDLHEAYLDSYFSNMSFLSRHKFIPCDFVFLFQKIPMQSTFITSNVMFSILYVLFCELILTIIHLFET